MLKQVANRKTIVLHTHVHISRICFPNQKNRSLSLNIRNQNIDQTALASHVTAYEEGMRMRQNSLSKEKGLTPTHTL